MPLSNWTPYPKYQTITNPSSLPHVHRFITIFYSWSCSQKQTLLNITRHEVGENYPYPSSEHRMQYFCHFFSKNIEHINFWPDANSSFLKNKTSESKNHSYNQQFSWKGNYETIIKNWKDHNQTLMSLEGYTGLQSRSCLGCITLGLKINLDHLEKSFKISGAIGSTLQNVQSH
jgi:hypothetical protein